VAGYSVELTKLLDYLQQDILIKKEKREEI
jgi:hypothetical protein